MSQKKNPLHNEDKPHFNVVRHYCGVWGKGSAVKNTGYSYRVPSIHMVQSSVTPIPWGQAPSSGLCQHHTQHTNTHAGKTLMHIKDERKINLVFFNVTMVHRVATYFVNSFIDSRIEIRIREAREPGGGGAHI